MKRIMNLRPVFLAFVCFVLGILMFTWLWLTNSLPTFVLGGFVVTFGVLLVGAVLYSQVVKAENKTTKWFLKHKFVFVLLLVSLLLGYATMGISNQYFKSVYPNPSGEYYIIGEISDSSYEKNGYTHFVLNQVVITNESGSQKLPGNVTVMLFNDGVLNNLATYSSYMEFHGTITKTPFYNSGYNFVKYYQNSVYDATILNNSANYYVGKATLAETIRQGYFNAFSQNLPSETANLAYSLLFGGDENLSQDMLTLFSSTGVVHIISVSGLHVAVLTVLILGLLKLLKVKGKYHLYILFVLLLAYSYLCGFVPSVLRASVMSLTLLLAFKVGERYDALSALSLSGLLILLISPVQLFSLGFQLSFVCIFAMITLVPYLNHWLKAIRVPSVIAYPVSVTICVTVLTYPVIANIFGEIALYGVFGNLIAVPLYSLAYVLLFVFGSLVALIPALGFLLAVPQIFMHFGNISLGAIGKLPLATVWAFSDGYWSLLLLLLLAFLVKFVWLKPQLKSAIAITLFAFVVGVNVYYNLPNTYKTNSLTVLYQTDSNVGFITTEEGQHILVGTGFNNEKYIHNYVRSLKINKINTIVAYDYAFKYHETLLELCEQYGVEQVVIMVGNSDANSFIQQEFSHYETTILSTMQSVNLHGITLKPLIDNDMVLATEIVSGNSTMLFVKNSLLQAQLRMLEMAALPQYDVVVMNNISANLATYNIQASTLITMKNTATSANQIYLVKQLNQITIAV